MKKNKNEKETKSRLGEDIPDSFGLVQKFGTYEIQPTADTANLFPTVAQGLPDRKVNNPKRRRPE